MPFSPSNIKVRSLEKRALLALKSVNQSYSPSHKILCLLETFRRNGQRLCRDWIIERCHNAQAAVNALMGTASRIQVPYLLQVISCISGRRHSGGSKEIFETRHPIKKPVFSEPADYRLFGLQDQRWISKDPAWRTRIPLSSAHEAHPFHSL